MNRRLKSLGLGASLIISAMAPSVAHADDATVTAEALFQEGKRLLDAGEVAAGCAKLEGSDRLAPAIGTLLNLAKCHEQLGRMAQAWAEYRRAAALAHSKGDTRREPYAVAQAARLEPLLPRLQLLVAAPADGETVTRDGLPVDASLFGLGVPVEPGEHELVATAPGRKTFRQTYNVPASGATAVTIPELEVAPAAAPVVAKSTTLLRAPGSRGEPAKPPRSSVAWPKTPSKELFGAAVGAGALSVFTVGLGTVYGLRASKRWQEAKSGCPPAPAGCSSGAVQLGRQADSDATVASAAFVVSIVSAAASTTLFVLWHSDGTSAVELGPTSARLTVALP